MSTGNDIPSSNPSKIAIKGFSLSTKSSSKPLSFSTKPKPTSASKSSHSLSTSTTLGKRPRTALHADSDSEDDQRPVKHEVVTAFDGGNAITESSMKKEKELLVIPKLGNRDWRAELRKARAGKNLLPPEVQARMNGEKVVEAVNVINTDADASQWGLIVKEKKAEIGDQTSIEVTVAQVPLKTVVTAEPEKSTDQLAIEALMGVEPTKTGPALIIPSNNNSGLPAREIEEDAYHRAMREAPDVSTLEDYEAVPVEEFGAAMLRGMGWKEGDSKKGRIDRPKEVVRRPNRLGLGAKELKGEEELGAWVQTLQGGRGGRGGGGRGGERRPKANEYREKREKEREGRDERYGSHRRDRDGDRHRARDTDRNGDRDRYRGY